MNEDFEQTNSQKEFIDKKPAFIKKERSFVENHCFISRLTGTLSLWKLNRENTDCL